MLVRSAAALLALMLVGSVRAEVQEASLAPPAESVNGGNLFRRFAIDQKLLVQGWLLSESKRPSFTIPLLFGWTTAAFADEGGAWDVKWAHEFEDATSGSQGVAEDFTRLGDAGTAIALTGGTWLVAKWTKHTHLQHTTSLAAEAMLNAAVDSTILKIVTRRPRPAAGGSGDFFVAHPGPGQSPDSFPSGHAMGSFAVATVFARCYSEHRAVPWIVYGGATLIGLSRIALGRHFPSDVLVGAVLGHSIGTMVVRRDQGDIGPGSPFRIEPLLPSEGHGAGVAYRRTW